MTHPEMPLVRQHLHAGRLAEAEAALRRVLATRPDLVEARLLLGDTLRAGGRPVDAALAYQDALRREPGRVDTHERLAAALWALGRGDDALNVLGGAVLMRHGLGENRYTVDHGLPLTDKLEAAADDIRRLIACKPDHAESHFKLAGLHHMLGRDEEAIAGYERAIQLRPTHTHALSNLGAALKKLKRLDEALAVYERAVAADPNNADALYNCGNSLQMRGHLDEAAAMFRRALALRGDFLEANSNLLTTLNYTTGISRAEVFAEHRRFEERFATGPATQARPHTHSRDPGRRLRVGYVSPDFWRHSCAYYVLPLLAHHDRRAVEIFGYSDVKRPDSFTARIQSHCDHWRETLGWKHEAVAERVRADGIDILVDLNGHFADSRLLAFAAKPAPVQVTWLGYPNTTGFTALDYRLVDIVTDPPGDADPFHTEALVRLPGGFLCYMPVPESPAVAPPPAAARGFITFGSFNNMTKVTHEVVATWAEILRRVPGSRLLLKAKQLDDEGTARRFRQMFQEHGVDAGRVDLMSWSLLPGGHLELYGEVDIALDPFPYNGTTTTCEALWMGAPVLTLLGDRHAGRVGASLLTTVGLPQLIAPSREAYVARAVELAADPTGLAEVRAGLRDRMRASPLLDGAGFARKVEAAYRFMWWRWCDGQPPVAFALKT